MVSIVWQTDTHSTFNYMLTIHFTSVRALAILVVIGPGCVQTAHSVLWNTENAVHSGEPLSEVSWSTGSVPSHSSPGLQLITLHGPGLMKLYIVTKIKKPGLENEHNHEHAGRTLTIKQHP